MSDDDPEGGNGDPADDGRERGAITRRRMLLGGGSLGVVGGARALYNTVLGYGQLGMGTNLKEQDLAGLLAESLSLAYEEPIAGTEVRSTDDGLVVDGETRLRFGDDDRKDAAAVDSAFGTDGRIGDLFADLSAFRDGAYAFEFHQPPAFFDRVEAADTRPGIVTAIREKRDRVVDPDVVERFAGAEPRNPAALVDGLTDGFREHTQYDVARYLAGSIEDNVIFGAADLRQYFEGDVDFEALLESETTGIFCWELVFRSIEAFQSVRPARQSIPVAACYVSDRRHKHAFTGILSAIRVDGALRLPVTFIDYTHSTLYDDVRLTGVLGEGLAAYNDGHRADEIWW